MSDILPTIQSALEGRYRLDHEIGAGGMATVYLAEDLRHERKVAIKVLKPELSAILGGERFLNEIRVTANLQHPHILPLYDSGEAAGHLYYVMPYVRGESLRQRLEREKQLVVEEAVKITAAVASALDYAHRHGVVHRDIKPANILLHDGQPLVADFGIALAVSMAGGDRLTETGLSLGTPFYMSPEQATGDHNTDGRSDVYALACVGYEMLAGDPPHTGSTTQSVLAKIVAEPPAPVTSVRPATPEHVAAALAKALEKLPADRFSSAADFAAALTTPTLATRAVPAMAKPVGSSGWLGRAAIAAVALVVGFGLGRTGRAPVTASEGLGRFALQLAPITSLATGFAIQVAMPPDGSAVAFVGRGQRGNQVFLRAMADSIPRAVRGTEGAQAAFFSPDGQRVGFWLPNRLQWVPLEGGTPTLIADNAGAFAVWTDRGEVVYTDPYGRSLLIAGPDGTGRAVAEPPDGTFQSLSPLPGGEKVLATLLAFGRSSSRVVAVSLVDGSVEDVGLPDVVMAQYVNSGHLVYQRRTGGPLMAAPYDLRSLSLAGESMAIAPDARITFRVMPQWAVAGSSLAYVPPAPFQLVIVDRQGRETVLRSDPRTYHHPRVSPDGSLVALDITDPDARDIWVVDMRSRGMSRLTVGEIANDPYWSPDGRRLAYASLRGSTRSMWMRNADGSGAADSIHGDSLDYSSGTFAPDGSSMVVSTALLGGLIAIPLDGSGAVRRVEQSRPTEAYPALSPDGRWLAYVSDESGRQEVYLRPYPSPGGRVLISLNGGSEPVWSPDGGEITYREDSGGGARLIAVRIDETDGIRVTERVPLFDVGDYVIAEDHANYDVLPDGSGFVMVKSPQAGQIQIVQHWEVQLGRR